MEEEEEEVGAVVFLLFFHCTCMLSTTKNPCLDYNHHHAKSRNIIVSEFALPDNSIYSIMVT